MTLFGVSKLAMWLLHQQKRKMGGLDRNSRMNSHEILNICTNSDTNQLDRGCTVATAIVMKPIRQLLRGVGASIAGLHSARTEL